MTTRRRAPAMKREATKSKLRSFSFTVILFCLHIPSILRLPPTLTAFCLLKQSLGLPYLYSPKMRYPPSFSSANILISAIKTDRICWCGCVGEPYAAVLQGTAVLLLAVLQYFHVPPESVPMVALPVYTFLRSTSRKLYIFFRREWWWESFVSVGVYHLFEEKDEERLGRNVAYAEYFSKGQSKCRSMKSSKKSERALMGRCSKPRTGKAGKLLH